MIDRIAEPVDRYGGRWTIEKLSILERYLDAYTTALKNQPFELQYIDAFAGTGQVALSDEDSDAASFLSGSAERAVNIAEKPFDKLVFVEKDPGYCEELAALRDAHPGRDISIVNSDANAYLRRLSLNWSQSRGVLFLDPFATEVEWSTLETVAGWKALDTWILFPVSAIARMLPKSRRPEDIAQGWPERLSMVFGDESWRDLYREGIQGNLFGAVEHERVPGVAELLTIYKNKLHSLFGDRFLDRSRTLRNSKNTPLFEFLFCVGSPSLKAIHAAKRIATHILDDL